MITAEQVKELREMTGAGMMECKKVLTEVDGDMAKAQDLLRERGIVKATKKAGRVAAEGLVESYKSADNKDGVLVEVNIETDFASKNPEFIEFVEDLAELSLSDDVKCENCLMKQQYKNEGTVAEALTQKIAKIGENMNIRRVAKCTTPGVKYVGYLHMGGKIGVIVGLKTEADAADIMTCGKDVAMQVASMNPQFVDESGVDPEYLAHEKEVLIAQAAKEAPDKPQNIIEKMITGRLKKQLKETCLVDQAFVKDSNLTVKEYVDSVAKALGKDIQVVEMVRYEVGEGIEKKQENFAEEVAKQMAQ